jgi:hypothetical protein
MRTKRIYVFIALFALAKLVFHFATNDLWSFHRDEFLYMALGSHLDWGYWSNPPFVGFMSWLAQGFFGGVEGISVAELRFIPALFSVGLISLACLIVKEFGGKIPAIAMTGVLMMACPGFLRPGMMFMPVIFEIFFWTLYSWLIIKYLKTTNNSYLLWLGLAIGIGMLNKYSTIFYVIGILVGMVLTNHRKLFQNRRFYVAIGISVLIALPNVFWQASVNFPVFSHMSGLRESQLVNVSIMNFIIDQILMCFPALIIWLSGFYWLFKKSNPMKFLGWISLTIMLAFLIMSGKGYYTLGIYPLLIAAGSVQLEHFFYSKKGKWGWMGLLIFAFISGWQLMPFSAPILSQEKMIDFCENVKTNYKFEDPMRWEDGEIHHLPQDYADMIGWNELAEIVKKGYSKRNLNTQNCLVYAENYGQAGAIEHFSNGLIDVNSFADSYRLWVEEKIPESVNHLIYVNDELGEDISALFEKIEVIGSIQNPLAREQGTTVYLCSQPNRSFKEFWEEKVKEVKNHFGI